MKRSSINFLTNAGGSQSIIIQNFDDQTFSEYWGSNYDEAIDGTLKQNLRGLRKKFRIYYDTSRHPEEYRNILNNIVTDLTGGLDFFYMGFDSSSFYRVTLDQETLYKIDYVNQHGLFIPSISFIGYELGIEVIEVVTDYRLITEAVDEALDWGLITDSPTTFDDYGSI